MHYMYFKSYLPYPHKLFAGDIMTCMESKCLLVKEIHSWSHKRDAGQLAGLIHGTDNNYSYQHILLLILIKKTPQFTSCQKSIWYTKLIFCLILGALFHLYVKTCNGQWRYTNEFLMFLKWNQFELMHFSKLLPSYINLFHFSKLSFLTYKDKEKDKIPLPCVKQRFVQNIQMNILIIEHRSSS